MGTKVAGRNDIDYYLWRLGYEDVVCGNEFANKDVIGDGTKWSSETGKNTKAPKGSRRSDHRGKHPCGPEGS